jgi:hypothetical protein
MRKEGGKKSEKKQKIKEKKGKERKRRSMLRILNIETNRCFSIAYNE